MKRNRTLKLFERALILSALKESFVKLNPKVMMRNPVMFSVEISTLIMMVITLMSMFTNDIEYGSFNYNLVIAVLLFLTLLFANFAEAIAEARGKAQAASLRKTREDTPAKRMETNGTITIINSASLLKDDLFIAEAGDTIPLDGEIIDGIASIDESAITGESAPVIREAGTDQSGVIGGTRVLSDRIIVKVTTAQGESFLDKMIQLVE
ncbi:MAG: potassium-transporting ATPase subunit B, partial [Ignavibacteriaceae bacterium]|nr:potassium-transporting ATPase subunit B [Ignavibacteriaceae bacterium]